MEISLLGDRDMNPSIQGNNSKRNHFNCRCAGWEVRVAECMPTVPSQVAHRLVRNCSPSASSTPGEEETHTPGSAGRHWVQSWDLCFWSLCSSSCSLANPGWAFPALQPHFKQKNNTCLDFLKEVWHYLLIDDKHSVLIQKAQTCHQHLNHIFKPWSRGRI